MEAEFNFVKLLYPNEWRKNISELGVNPGIFNWFLCSKRLYDAQSDLYYILVSPDIQFFNEITGETLLARGLKKQSSDDKKEVKRARLLILSEPHNKKVLCRKYGIMCGCDSEKDILSTDCDLVLNKRLIVKGARKSIDLGYDGAVIKHDCLDECLDCVDNPICQNATFVFKTSYKILEPVTEIERCGIVKYARRHNSYIRNKIKEFPSIEEIDRRSKSGECSKLSIDLASLINKYIEHKTR